MSNIHPSTLKRAQQHGVMLQEDKDENIVALWPKMNQRMVGQSAKVVLDNMIALIDMKTHYRSFQLYNGATDGDGRPVFRVSVPKVGDFDHQFLQQAFDNAVTGWEEYRAELSEEEADAEEGDYDDVKSVVSPKYRAKYAELGHPTHSGDELALALNNIVSNRKGTNIDLFVEICAVNGVDLSKYKRDTRGWQGRLRMTGRNILARRIYDTGVLKMPEHLGQADIRMSADWMASQRFVQEGT